MAQLSSLISFTAGTPAIANDVNQNFTDIRNHINGANIDTENIAATLTSRAGGPILYLNQASENQIALSIQNSQTNTAMQILQSAVLSDSSKAVLKISDTVTQTAGKAELWLSLDASSTIPGILVEHGANTSLSLTKTQLNLFNSAIQATSTSLNLFSSAIQANSAGVLSATTVNATTVGATDINTSGLITATAPVSDSIALKIKGRSSDNQSQIALKSNNDATTYAEITSKSTGLTFNLPDTADSYIFNINNVEKLSCDNNRTEIIGRTNGASVSAGRIGETLTALGNFNTQQTGTGGVPLTFTSGPSLTLSAGLWLVIGSTRVGEAGGGGEAFMVFFRQSSNGATFGFGGPMFHASGGSPIPCVGVVNLSSSDTIQFYFQQNGSGTIGAGLALPNMRCGFIQAVRIG